MSNMSYCRFQNTLLDLQDCADNLADKLSDEDHRARRRLVKTCLNILEELGLLENRPSDAQVEEALNNLVAMSEAYEAEENEGGAS